MSWALVHGPALPLFVMLGAVVYVAAAYVYVRRIAAVRALSTPGFLFRVLLFTACCFAALIAIPVVGLASLWQASECWTVAGAAQRCAFVEDVNRLSAIFIELNLLASALAAPIGGLVFFNKWLQRH